MTKINFDEINQKYTIKIFFFPFLTDNQLGGTTWITVVNFWEHNQSHNMTEIAVSEHCHSMG